MLVESIVILAACLIIHHHAVYPWLLKRIVARLEAKASGEMFFPADQALALVVPAYNEAGLIVAKLQNIATLTYERALLKVVIVCDGCTDDTAWRAQEWVATSKPAGLHVEVIEHRENRGKVAVLNETIAALCETYVALSDVSAQLDADALLSAASHFADADVGFVTGRYALDAEVTAGEALYWSYQTQVKQNEAQLGAPMGAHGAFYMFRRACWIALEPDTINDDFILPMRIVAQGYRGVYDSSIVIREREGSSARIDFSRRLRIAAGNVQQVARCAALAHLRRPGLAFVFLSGKALRAFAPLLMMLCLIGSAVLALASAFWAMMLVMQVGLYCLAWLAWTRGERASSAFAALGYLGAGHLAGLLGGARYLVSGDCGSWGRGKDGVWQDYDYVHPAARFGKRVIDILCGLCAMAALVVLFAPIAIAIKLGSPGPIFYRQMRVGRVTPRSTQLFWLAKFRTMRTDAETVSGAVWASADDPRVTSVGRFLRKTRLDELPQAWNVLVGEMSVVGPRPERPQFFQRLEGAIPFYVERTYGLKPGITGLAQVSQGYDSSIEDVRSKVLYDHVYALRISRPLQWLVTDVSIILRTFGVMVLGKGQ